MPPKKGKAKKATPSKIQEKPQSLKDEENPGTESDLEKPPAPKKGRGRPPGTSETSKRNTSAKKQRPVTVGTRTSSRKRKSPTDSDTSKSTKDQS